MSLPGKLSCIPIAKYKTTTTTEAMNWANRGEQKFIEPTGLRSEYTAVRFLWNPIQLKMITDPTNASVDQSAQVNRLRSAALTRIPRSVATTA